MKGYMLADDTIGESESRTAGGATATAFGEEAAAADFRRPCPITGRGIRATAGTGVTGDDEVLTWW